MNTFQTTAAAYGIASAAACCLFHRFIADAVRTMRRPSEAERVAQARQRVGMPADTYTGPDSLRLLQDTDQYLDIIALTDRDLAPTFGPGAVKPDARQLEER